ncbi:MULTISPECIES: FliM/FliN family flagellar motor switch protein [Pseudorhizobium]|jgi:flagellar motor switch protein FliM|uniref:Flagellar motor switch protein FliM n=1 Tax=Pseudorhizobium pelagicum TaxID=1509405 RepID=A0A922TAW2_9HYPH|nr:MULTISPECIES: FliM/FliN family flagellar motor switch protein [Pseudorhizobium]MBU1314004.1 FliM/FliN family flagellar motor switch protein [Alphaproteobacteria bacterium]MDY6960580.1 FliM/FliN family flagellar motor switch protein [Pseudomonadota bacterium]KEQ05795.1 flagellar motor switch protein FliM [Pseudorhizobium pelagicum]KEQ10739.1 flagellar motor switch protein FliM [Pseudorhizobium pelagicum]MBU1552356.1 FliM/FliN family flagellar motor switch protein [Alphaproteobacteria bacteri|tara:strand:- start:5950 stop:6900 length:951 start_codon:yes stop_codon:yes gene_type:complete
MMTTVAVQTSPTPIDHALLAKLTGGLGDRKTIEKISGEFGQLYADFLPDVFHGETGIPINVSFTGCTSGLMTDLIRDLGETFTLADGSLRNWSPNFVLACGNSLVIALMEQMLGALPETIEQPFDRPLSAIELDLAQMVLSRMGLVLQSGVNAPGSHEMALEAAHNFEDRQAPDAAVPQFGVTIRMAVELGKVSSEIALVLPQKAFLKTKVVVPKAAGQLSKNKQEWHERISEQVRRSQVTLEARVRLESLTLGTISRLAAGDVIAFHDRKDVAVQVSANGKDMYSCELGRSGERYTVRVKDNMSTEDEILDHLMG